MLVLGPRNVSKSELLRCVLSRRLGVGFVWLDAGLARLEGSLGRALEVARGLDKRFLVEALARSSSRRLVLLV